MDNFHLLSPEDYYRFNAPFRLWLQEVKGKQLGDYKTDEAKVIFTKEFIKDWNESRLSKEFYLKGPEIKARDLKGPILRPDDKFGFSKQEESKLFSHKLPKSHEFDQSRFRSLAPFDKSYLKRRAEDLDELVPKKEGHAKIVEDRRAKSAYTRIERNNPHDLELPDDQLFSGSTSSSRRPNSSDTDDYATLLRLQKERAARKEREIDERRQEKQRELQNKIDKYNQREQEVQDMLKKMVNKR